MSDPFLCDNTVPAISPVKVRSKKYEQKICWSRVDLITAGHRPSVAFLSASNVFFGVVGSWLKQARNCQGFEKLMMVVMNNEGFCKSITCHNNKIP